MDRHDVLQCVVDLVQQYGEQLCVCVVRANRGIQTVVCDGRDGAHEPPPPRKVEPSPSKVFEMLHAISQSRRYLITLKKSSGIHCELLVHDRHSFQSGSNSCRLSMQYEASTSVSAVISWIQDTQRFTGYPIQIPGTCSTYWYVERGSLRYPYWIR